MQSQIWWNRSVIPGFRRQRQEIHIVFEVGLVCIENSRLGRGTV